MPDTIDFPEWAPARLRERALHWNVPPGAFAVQAAFDRVILWQVLDWDLEPVREDDDNPESRVVGWRYRNGSKLMVPERVLEREKNTNPRCLVISAGLQALDIMRSNGIELGDYVRIVRLQPYRLPVELDVDFQTHYVIPVRASDIIASEDAAERLRSGSLKVEVQQRGNYKGHFYVGEGIPDLSIQTPSAEF